MVEWDCAQEFLQRLGHEQDALKLSTSACCCIGEKNGTTEYGRRLLRAQRYWEDGFHDFRWSQSYRCWFDVSVFCPLYCTIHHTAPASIGYMRLNMWLCRVVAGWIRAGPCWWCVADFCKELSPRVASRFIWRQGNIRKRHRFVDWSIWSGPLNMLLLRLTYTLDSGRTWVLIMSCLWRHAFLGSLVGIKNIEWVADFCETLPKCVDGIDWLSHPASEAI